MTTRHADPPQKPPALAQGRPRTGFDRLLERTALADSFRVNLVLVILIVLGSLLLSMAILWLAAAPFGVAMTREVVLLVGLISTLVPLAVGIPGVLFGDALVRRVNWMKKDLEQALIGATLASRAKTEFLANISHEIRTPMNGVLGMAQVLETTPLSDAQREHLRLIRDSGDMLMALIDDVLDLARIEAGKLALHPAPHPLRRTIADTIALFAARAAENGTTLEFRAADDLPDRAVFDQLRMRQCLGNLVSNAVKFTRAGSVLVEAQCSPASAGKIELCLRVTDTGIGIAPDALGGLFSPFAQASTQTAQDFGGTGLGLSISRRLARKMGGDLTVTSTLGAGSCFTLRFLAETLAPDALIADPEQAPPPPGNLEGLTLLVVDDSTANRRVATAMLTPLGVQCIPVESGALALAHLAQTPCDGVLLDMQMPGLDGPATLQAIRRSGAAWANVPVIALTANAMPGERERCLDLGMQGYATKPIRMALLRDEIARALRRVPQA